MNIGEKIRHRRIELGWSQQQLADKMGYTSKSTIARIEKGSNDVAQRNIAKFADVLNVSIAYLMDWEEDTDNTVNDPLFVEFESLIANATPQQKSQILAIAKALLQQQ